MTSSYSVLFGVFALLGTCLVFLSSFALFGVFFLVETVYVSLPNLFSPSNLHRVLLFSPSVVCHPSITGAALLLTTPPSILQPCLPPNSSACHLPVLPSISQARLPSASIAVHLKAPPSNSLPRLPSHRPRLPCHSPAVHLTAPPSISQPRLPSHSPASISKAPHSISLLCTLCVTVSAASFAIHVVIIFYTSVIPFGKAKSLYASKSFLF